MYLDRIAEVNDDLHAVIQTNPGVRAIAASRDADYESNAPRGYERTSSDSCTAPRLIANWALRRALHGIPILVKNLFHVSDKMLNTGKPHDPILP